MADEGAEMEAEGEEEDEDAEGTGAGDDDGYSYFGGLRALEAHLAFVNDGGDGDDGGDAVALEGAEVEAVAAGEEGGGVDVSKADESRCGSDSGIGGMVSAPAPASTAQTMEDGDGEEGGSGDGGHGYTGDTGGEDREHEDDEEECGSLPSRRLSPILAARGAATVDGDGSRSRSDADVAAVLPPRADRRFSPPSSCRRRCARRCCGCCRRSRRR
jgi:hypothetical protein